MRRLISRLGGAALEGALISLLVVGLIAIPAFAAKGGGRGGATSGSTGSSLSLVMVDPTDTVVNQGDQVTFEVSTTATDKPWVRLDCYVNGAWVSTTTHGFFPTYPWAPNYTLASGAWTDGAGDCTATLYRVTSNGRSRTLATLSFHVQS
ncbi:MAG TPA: hypothetical protein VHU77_00775 [Candidatus Limnocylindria bacterium]|nr:hypothetical protein [Candidatus Limnocylindria bacterium]